MTRSEFLLALVANRPLGAKVDIPAIVKAFTPTQAQIVAAIEKLIAEGKLDRETLRRSVKSETCAESQTDPKCLSETEAEASAPIDLDRLLACFGDEFETPRIVAQRFGADSPQRIVRHTRTLHERGLVEQSPPTNGNPFCLWRRKSNSPAPHAPANGEAAGGRRPPLTRNTQGASGTARKASSAEESTSAKRIKDRAPSGTRTRRNQRKSSAPLGDRRYAVNRQDPDEGMRSLRAKGFTDRELIELPDAVAEQLSKPTQQRRTKLRDGTRDPTQPPSLPLTEARDRQITRAHRMGAAVRRGQEAEAARLVDAGVDPSTQSTVVANTMRELIRRRADEARLGDPVEQAKLVLRKHYPMVVNAEVMNGPKDHFYVGRELVDRKRLLEMAEAIAA